MKSILFAGVMASALVLSACVTPTTQMPSVSAADASAEAQKQSELAIRMRLDERARVSAIAERLFVANAELCPDFTRSVGLRVDTIAEFKGPFRSAAAGMGFSAAPQVDWVAAGGPAATAGLQSGDVIVAIDGQPVMEKADASKAIHDALAKDSADTRLKYRRSGVEQEVVVHPIRACNYDVVILDSDEINAAADGRRIAINRGVIRFVKSDDELALVMAHELAHDTEKHIRAKTANATMGLVGGAAVDVLFALGGVNTGGAFMKAGQAAGAGYASAEFEGEADYVGMYYMARAGYDVNGVEDFWRRMAVEEPKSIYVHTDHPATPARYVAIGKTRDEILAKRAAGAPLFPERRAGHKTDAAPPTPTATPAKTTPAGETAPRCTDRLTRGAAASAWRAWMLSPWSPQRPFSRLVARSSTQKPPNEPR